MEIPLKDETPEEEFITIIQNLVNSDLAALYQILNLEDEKEQIQRTRSNQSSLCQLVDLKNNTFQLVPKDILQ
jgi:hypothetical protein